MILYHKPYQAIQRPGLWIWGMQQELCAIPANHFPECKGPPPSPLYEGTFECHGMPQALNLAKFHARVRKVRPADSTMEDLMDQVRPFGRRG